MNIFFFLLLLFALLEKANAQIDATGPLKGDLRVHDPVMIKQGDTYYIFHTGNGISSKISKNKIYWKKDSSVFAKNNLPSWFRNDIPDQNGNLWAPDIHYRDGKYHLYYSVSAWMNFNSSIGYATNKTLDQSDPEYKWEDQGQVISFKNGGEGVNVIDPNIFLDKDKRLWLIYGSYKAGLRMTELNRKTGQLKTNPPQLITLTTSLGEGAFIIKGPKYYYIFASRGRCCAGMSSTYQIVMGRSEKVTGPYLDKEGKSWVENNYSVFLAGDSTAPGKGHNGFFTEGDTTFIVFHAYTKAANGAPVLNIRPLYIDENDWPVIGNSNMLFRREPYQ
ncbi:MAG: arabinan endo-1,5-alpha-L-arabinosidase [Niabella sp.]